MTNPSLFVYFLCVFELLKFECSWCLFVLSIAAQLSCLCLLLGIRLIISCPSKCCAEKSTLRRIGSDKLPILPICLAHSRVAGWPNSAFYLLLFLGVCFVGCFPLCECCRITSQEVILCGRDVILHQAAERLWLVQCGLAISVCSLLQVTESLAIGIFGSWMRARCWPHTGPSTVSNICGSVAGLFAALSSASRQQLLLWTLCVKQLNLLLRMGRVSQDQAKNRSLHNTLTFLLFATKLKKKSELASLFTNTGANGCSNCL